MGVDGQPALLMKWDNGRGLNLLPLSVGLALRSKQLLQLAGSPCPIRPLCPPLEICRGRGSPINLQISSTTTNAHPIARNAYCFLGGKLLY
ncbi:hypothetical protein AALA61_13595 [Oscillospiraceae bacterium 42-9]